MLPQQTQLAGPFPVVEKPADHDLDYRTHFERRMRMHGAAVYRSEFRKQA
jgi:tRNA (guanine-N7-)-methyltransferase